MAVEQGLMKDRVKFLSQAPEKLRATRGQVLYDTLNGLGLDHSHYFRALGTNVQEYCAEEFGVDLGRITVERFSSRTQTRIGCFPTWCVRRCWTGCSGSRGTRD